MTKIELFSDSFAIKDIDPQGKKFDRVSRIIAHGETVDAELTLDVNTEIYPLKSGQKFTLLLTNSISADPSLADRDSWRESLSRKTLADDYDYVMSGKVYKFDDATGSKCAVYASFGGLLMCLTSDYRSLQEFNVGQSIFLLMRK